MTKYKLEIVKGTKVFVLKELETKFPEHNVLNTKSESIEFECEINDVDAFYELKSALRIEKENGLIRNLFRRDWKVENVPAGINPSLAYVLCIIGELNEDDIVYDPFCGAGTIPITAAKYFGVNKVFASDISGTAVDKTIQNSKAANLSPKKFITFRSNISQVKLKKNSVSKIISNLPFGVRTNDHEQNVKAYMNLALRSHVFLREGGKLILYTQEKELVRENFKSPLFEIEDEMVIEQGGLYPSIFIIKKLS
jgi:tRNA (guanine6-N2)-methyltransferase